MKTLKNCVRLKEDKPIICEEPDYNDESVWNNEIGFNFGARVRKDSWFLLQFDEGPIPVCIHCAAITWFNDLRMLAGYMKYVLIGGTAFLNMLNPAEPGTQPLAEYLDVPNEDEDFEESRQELLREVRAIDVALQGPETELAAALEKIVEEYNDFYIQQNYTFGAKLIHGKDAVRAFYGDRKACSNYEEAYQLEKVFGQKWVDARADYEEDDDGGDE